MKRWSTGPIDEASTYIKYTFPSCNVDQNTVSSRPMTMSTYFISSRLNANLASELEHRLVLAASDSIRAHLADAFGLSDNVGVVFELWAKSSYPNVRERLLARAQLPLDKLLATRSAVLPLVDPANAVSTATGHVGQLLVGVAYRCEELSYNLHSNEHFLVPFRTTDESQCVTLSVGVLRAYGLEPAASAFLKRHSSTLVSLQNSHLFVKFSLGFLNRPQVLYFNFNIFYSPLPSSPLPWHNQFMCLKIGD